MFNALPAYFGGKRRLIGQIFKDLPGPGFAPVFVDAFLGGGSVSLYAKARGYRVVCNDVAMRSHIVGRALIENSTVTLDNEDIARLSMPIKEKGFAETHLAPDVFPSDHARYLDLFLANSRSLSGPKRWLALLLVIKQALRLRPMGNFGAKTIVKQAAAGAWEEMNPHYVRDLNLRGLPRHPIRLAERILPHINGGIFANGLQNEAHRGDVFEFLARVQGGVCYLDPPYSSTSPYERAMRPLDELLAGEPIKPVPNPFSTELPEVILPRLLKAADHIPTLVLSYGNQRIDIGGLMDLMREFRPHVTGQAIDFVHCSGLSSDESRKKNQELLVIGRNQ